MEVLAIAWWVSWIILLGYYLLIFRPRKPQDTGGPDTDAPGVSIIIAVKNESERLIESLPSFLTQSYPAFEIIIVDDHSDKTESQKLLSMDEEYASLTVIRSPRVPGKKNALLTGIEKARYEWILCTDADCRPETTSWIRSMVNHSKNAGMVLGYSPYIREKGMLNLFVCFETTMTGMQYLSWAVSGRPYMGVGRNLLYSKSLFLDLNPYRQQPLPYGDDDLWVQQAATTAGVNVSFGPEAHILSAPPMSWKSWWKQKHRHLSAARQYTRSSWWQPGLFGMALIFHWGVLPFLLCADHHAWIGEVAVTGWGIRWIVYSQWAGRLNEKRSVFFYPALELLYTLYLAVMGWTAMLVKKKTWN